MERISCWVLVSVLILVSGQVDAQGTWSLERCINHALENNLGIKQSQLAVEQALLSEQLSRNARHPSLNASSSFGYQFGRTIDPTSNTFSLNALAGQSLGINANATLYNGGRINNQIEQSKLDAMAAREDLLQNKNDIALTVATSFINVLFSKEQTSNAEQRLVLTEKQLENTRKLISAGALPANDVLELEAQQALNQQDIIIQDNAVNTALLNLKLLLQLPADQDFDIEVPSIDVNPSDEVDTWTVEEVYTKAVNNQPFIKAGKYRMESALLQEDIAKANKLPRLSIFGGIDSNYSDQFPEFGDPIVMTVGTDVVVEGIPMLPPGGVPLTIFQDVTIPNNIGTLGYFNQLSDNLGQNIGVALSIPIYNNGQANIAQDQAKLAVLNTEYANEQLDQQLRSDIQQALTDARASKLQLIAAQKSMESRQASFSNTEKRFNLGAVNSLDLSVAKNLLDAAQIDLIVAKYQYLFNVKVVEFYRGEPLKF